MKKSVNQEVYWYYGLIRYVVNKNHCANMSCEEVKKNIRESDYQHLIKCHKLSREKINQILDIMCQESNTPG